MKNQPAKYVIIVPTNEDKMKLMESFEFIHDLGFDDEQITVYKLTHEYLDDDDRGGQPNNIVVNKELYEKHCIHYKHS